MGIVFSRGKVDFEVCVKTGDVKGSGTDSNVYCCLIDSNGNKSRDLLLDCKFRNDFEKGNEDIFKIHNASNLGDIENIELWRDGKGLGDDWFVDYVKVRKVNNVQSNNNNKNTDQSSNNTNQNSKNTDQNSKDTDQSSIDTDQNNKNMDQNNRNTDQKSKDNNNNNNKNNNNNNNNNNNTESTWLPFPCNRWILPNRKYHFCLYDSVLPQEDKMKSQRDQELSEKQATYAYETELTGLPRRWDITARKVKYLAQKKITSIFNKDKWNSLGDLLDVYKGTFGIPYGYYNWRSDQKFGQQRLTGCNATVIRRCTQVPEKFAVTNEMVEPLLEGMTLDEAITQKKIYYCDLQVLENIKCKNDRKICCPFAMFFANKAGELVPIAIQLFQTPSEDNPVFLPTDPQYTWMLAKMYYNNADCSLHQACTHLGFTHLVCESICISVHRSLSPSHPVFRMLAPHFLYLMAINSLAVEKLLAPEGWIDVTMTMGACGLMQIVKRKWGQWRMDVEGWLPNDIKNRGCEDKEALPTYYYRDDAELILNAIYDYVYDILSHVYDTPEKLKEDNEIQQWGAMLTDPVDGAGIKGVFGDGKFEVLEDLVKTVCATIFISSVQHAAANFCQYDEYAFPPHYPATMNGEIIRDKKPRTEAEILAALPDKETTLSIMVVTKLLSERGTNGIGQFEVQYQYEPKAVQAVEKFKAALHEISITIKARNATIKQPYPYLNPEEVPNAISI